MIARPEDEYLDTMQNLDFLYDHLTPEQRQALIYELKRVTFSHSVAALPESDQDTLIAAGFQMIKRKHDLNK